VYQYEKNLPIRKKQRQPDSYRKGNRGNRPRREDSIRRAARSFRRIVRSNLGGDAKPALLTLTMHQKLSYASSVTIFSKFAVRLRRLYGVGFRYIAVPEFQKRGAVHWHILIWGLPDHVACQGYFEGRGKYRHFAETCAETRSCERSTRFIQRLWLRGFCDCIETDGSVKLSGYLAKYLSKTMRDIRLRGKRAYYASRNIMRPMSVSGHVVAQFLDVLVDVDKSPLHSREFETEWLGKCHYKIYEL